MCVVGGMMMFFFSQGVVGLMGSNFRAKRFTGTGYFRENLSQLPHDCFYLFGCYFSC